MDNRNDLEEMKRQAELLDKMKKDGIESFLVGGVEPEFYDIIKLPSKSEAKEKILQILVWHNPWLIGEITDKILELFYVNEKKK